MRVAAAVSLALLSPTSAFVTPRLPSAPRASSTSALRMQIALDDLGAGETAPFGYFDPLGISSGRDESTIKKWRESELKHGRVAMLAAIGSLVQERFHPLFGFADKDMGGSIHHFQEINANYPGFWTIMTFIIGVIECNNILGSWQSPEEVPVGGIAGLKDDYITGDLGLDPLGVTKDPEQFLAYRNKELNNGRLAMIAILGIWAEELVGGVKEIF